MAAENGIEPCYAKVGKFLYHFASLEEAIDDAIGQLLKIEAATLNVIAANIDFGRKVSILFSSENLLAEMPDKTRKKFLKDTRSAIMDINDKRKVIAHCSFSPSTDGSVLFRRAVAIKELKIEDLRWSNTEFEKLFAKIDSTAKDVRRLVSEMKPYVPKLDFSDSRNSVYLTLFL